MVRSRSVATEDSARIAEALLRAVAGVSAARVRRRDGAGIEGIDIEVTDDVEPASMVHVVRTALLASMRLAVEPSAIRVSRARPDRDVADPGDGGDAAPAPISGSVAGGLADIPAPAGVVGGIRPPRVLALEILKSDAGPLRGRVVVEWNGAQLFGETRGDGALHPDCPLHVSGAAVLEALRSAAGYTGGLMALDGVTRVTVGGVECVVASVKLRCAWQVLHFPAVAAAGRNPERAAAAAVLRAAVRAMAAEERESAEDDGDASGDA